MELSFLLLVVAGLVGGYMAGLIGVGGGLIYIFVIPATLNLMGVQEAEMAQYTIANSIFAIFFASAAANYTQFKINNFFLRPVLLIGIFSILSSLLTLEYIVNTEWYDVKKFNLVVIALLLYMLVFTLLQAKKEAAFSVEQLKLWQCSWIGLCSGMIASVSGLGGGIVVIPLLNTLLKVDIKKAGSISSGVIMLTSLTMTIFNMTETTRFPFDTYSMGYIIFPIGLALSAGVLFSSPYGVRKAAQLSPKIISYIYAAILSLVITKKIVELIFIY